MNVSITNWLLLLGSAQSEKYFGYPGKEDHKYQVRHVKQQLLTCSKLDSVMWNRRLIKWNVVNFSLNDIKNRMLVYGI